MERTVLLPEIVNCLVKGERCLNLSDYKQFADNLGIHHITLEHIVKLSNTTDSPYATMSKILQEWLEVNERKGTVSQLVEILQEMGLEGVAESLKEKFIENSQAEIVLSSSILVKKATRTQWFGFRDPIPDFTGREQLLEDIHEALEEKDENGIVIHATLSGMGGIGKTELSRKYAVLHASKYGSVVWINAESSATILQSFQTLASESSLNVAVQLQNGKVKDAETLSQDVFKHFCESGLYERRPLFIYDNADNFGNREDHPGHEDRLRDFLPSRKMQPFSPAIIVTSRNRNWSGCSLKLIQIDIFTREEAVLFLRKALGSEESDDALLSSLAEELGYLPLALQQAVAFIKTNEEQLFGINGKKSRISGYLILLKDKSAELLGFPFSEDSLNPYEKTCLTTWNITLDRIRMYKSGELAIRILQNISLLSNASLHVKLVYDALKQPVSRGFWHTLRIAMFVRPVPAEVLAEDFQTAILLLKKYSLIQTDEDRVIVHKLVQKSVYLTMGNLDFQEKTKAVLCAIATSEARGVLIFQNFLSVLDALQEKSDKVEDSTLRYFNETVDKFMQKYFTEDFIKYGHENTKLSILMIKLAVIARELKMQQKEKELLKRAYNVAKSQFGSNNINCAKVLVIIINELAMSRWYRYNTIHDTLIEFLSILDKQVTSLSDTDRKKISFVNVFRVNDEQNDRTDIQTDKYIEMLKHYEGIMKAIYGDGDKRLRLISSELNQSQEYLEGFLWLKNFFEIPLVENEIDGYAFLGLFEDIGRRTWKSSETSLIAKNMSQCLDYVVGEGDQGSEYIPWYAVSNKLDRILSKIGVRELNPNFLLIVLKHKEKCYGPNSLRLAFILTRLSLVYKFLQEEDKAMEFMKQSGMVLRRNGFLYSSSEEWERLYMGFLYYDFSKETRWTALFHSNSRRNLTFMKALFEAAFDYKEIGLESFKDIVLSASNLDLGSALKNKMSATAWLYYQSFYYDLTADLLRKKDSLESCLKKLEKLSWGKCPTPKEGFLIMVLWDLSVAYKQLNADIISSDCLNRISDILGSAHSNYSITLQNMDRTCQDSSIKSEVLNERDIIGILQQASETETKIRTECECSDESFFSLDLASFVFRALEVKVIIYSALRKL